MNLGYNGGEREERGLDTERWRLWFSGAGPKPVIYEKKTSERKTPSCTRAGRGRMCAKSGHDKRLGLSRAVRVFKVHWIEESSISAGGGGVRRVWWPGQGTRFRHSFRADAARLSFGPTARNSRETG